VPAALYCRRFTSYTLVLFIQDAFLKLMLAIALLKCMLDFLIVTT
jgi:hypothetical protein